MKRRALSKVEERVGALMATLSERAVIGPLARFCVRRREQVLYLVVGGWNVVFGYGLWALFYFLLHRHLHYMVIQVIWWPFAVANAYVCYRRIVFRSQGRLRREVPRFALVYTAGLVVMLVLLPVLVRFLPFNLYAVQALLTAVVIVLTYLANKHFSFRAGTGEEACEEASGSET